MLKNYLFSKSFTFITVLFVLSINSCKKDRLTDDGKEELIGTWVWAYTIRDNNSGINSVPNYIDTITPISEGDTYKVEFYKKGKVHFYKNGVLTDKKRIVFNSWNYGDVKEKSFTINMNNDNDDRLRGSLNTMDFVGEKDTLVLWRSFPFDSDSENCNPAYFSCFKTNIFVKE